MKKLAKYLSISLIVTGVSGCSWLDVVPDNLPTINDAFSNRATAEKSLFSCYRFLPDPTNSFTYPAYFTSKDEFEYTRFETYANQPVVRISRGEQNSNSPLLDYWSGNNGGTSMFEAIRTCNIFLEGIYEPKDLPAWERDRWIAEVKFLKAYYHFFLLQLYGPIPIVKENIPLSASPDEVRVFREPVDECVDYIVQLLDEATSNLPLTISNHLEEDGRITQPIALAVKAKVLAWAASPLFNGNPDYQDWRDSRGKQLIPDTYNLEKWVKAAEAIRNAIDVCHSANHGLFRFNKTANPSTYMMNDSLVRIMNVRKAITERWNQGIIWSSMSPFSGAGYSDLQRATFPTMYSGDVIQVVSQAFASFNMAELFYSNKGIPINEDIDWDYAGRYQLQTATTEAGHGSYIQTGQQTVALHFNREPRFYASLCFDRGFMEISTATTNGGASFTPYLRFRNGEPGYANNNLFGYYPKKLIAFESSCTQGENRPYSGYDYRFPLIRLADLYLLYSEALNEVKATPDAEVYEWIDKVRTITGLKGVVESWKNSKYPNRPSNKDEMRKIIQHERLIELAFEGQRFWDVRRWKLAENLWTYRPQGWSFEASSAEGYYTVVYRAEEGRQFTFKDYLWPISAYDLRVNKNFVQTHGW